MSKLILNDGKVLFSEVVANVTSNINFGSIASAAGETAANITVTGAQLGDFVFVSAAQDTQGLRMFGWVSAANTVKVRAENLTGAAVDLPAGNFNIKVLR